MGSPRVWPSREALYELVWSKPSELVAAELGVSGVALAKHCLARNIPKPPRGYWARRSAGHRISRPRLPAGPQPKTKAVPPVVKFDPPPVKATVPWPPLVNRTERGYRDARVDVWGRLEVPAGGQPILDVRVSREALPRALQLYALIIAGLRRSRVHLVVDGGRTLVRAGHDEVRLRVKEQVQAQPGLPLIERRDASPWDTPRQQRAVGTGRLQVLVSEPEHFDFGPYRAQFRDGRVPVEGQAELMLAFFQGLPERATERLIAREHQGEARLANLRRKEDELSRLAALKAERHRRREEQQQCRAGLLDLARGWEDTERLRRYLQAHDEGAVSADLTAAEDYQTWKSWAEEQAREACLQQKQELQSWMQRVTKMIRWTPLEDELAQDV